MNLEALRKSSISDIYIESVWVFPQAHAEDKGKHLIKERIIELGLSVAPCLVMSHTECPDTCPVPVIGRLLLPSMLCVTPGTPDGFTSPKPLGWRSRAMHSSLLREHLHYRCNDSGEAVQTWAVHTKQWHAGIYTISKEWNTAGSAVVGKRSRTGWFDAAWNEAASLMKHSLRCFIHPLSRRFAINYLFLLINKWHDTLFDHIWLH